MEEQINGQTAGFMDEEMDVSHLEEALGKNWSQQTHSHMQLNLEVLSCCYSYS